jgi:hypothetical protein
METDLQNKNKELKLKLEELEVAMRIEDELNSKKGDL